jgi:hypothetical protein
VIRGLQDKLKGVRQELKEVTATIAVSRSKAAQAMAAKRCLLGEIESLGKSMKCEYLLKLPSLLQHGRVVLLMSVLLLQVSTSTHRGRRVM